MTFGPMIEDFEDRISRGATAESSQLTARLVIPKSAKNMLS